MSFSAVARPGRLGIYLRISEADDELGVRRHQKLCETRAEKEGWTVVKVYEDNRVSAWSRKPRPAYNQMLADMRSGHLDVVLAFGDDRLERNSEERIALLRVMQETGCRVHTITGGELDAVTAGGRFKAKITAEIAEYESEIKSERVKAKMAELRTAGKTQGGRRPFGLSDGRKELVPEEAALIREAAGRIIAGGKMYQVVQEWNSRGITTVLGKPWKTSGLREILVSNWSRGLTPDGNKAIWPQIIDPASARRLDAILNDPSRRQRRPEVKRYLLTGLLLCQRCQVTMGASNTNGKPGYGCRRCHRMRQLAEPLEEDITYRFFARVNETRVGNAMAGAEAEDDEQQAQLLALEAKKAEYFDMYDAGEITRSELRERRLRLDGHIMALQAEMRRDTEAEMRRQTRAKAFSMVQEWGALDIEQRRSVLEAFIEYITVKPALKGRTTYDPDRISVKWR